MNQLSNVANSGPKTNWPRAASVEAQQAIMGFPCVKYVGLHGCKAAACPNKVSCRPLALRLLCKLLCASLQLCNVVFCQRNLSFVQQLVDDINLVGKVMPKFANR